MRIAALILLFAAACVEAQPQPMPAPGGVPQDAGVISEGVDGGGPLGAIGGINLDAGVDGG